MTTNNNNGGIYPFVYLILSLMGSNQRATAEVYRNPIMHLAFVDLDMRAMRSAVYEMYCGQLATLLGPAVLRPEYIYNIIVQLGNDPQIGNSGKGTIWDWAGVPRHEQIGTTLRPIINFK